MEKRFVFGKNWFFEGVVPGENPDIRWGVVSKRKLYSGKSPYQKIAIFESKGLGKVLVLDGLIQLCTADEFVYHEMLVHPAFFYHPAPKRVLIIGGGDGGVLREVAKHPVEEIILVDIDKKVIDVSKKYLPQVPGGAFKDKRLKIFNEDALNFVKRYKNYFDIAINDLTDPGGVSLFLWTEEFYKDILRSLKENGVASFQTAYFDKGDGLYQKARKKIGKVFPFFKVHKAYVRYFPLDEHTFSVGSKKIDFDKLTFEEIANKYKKLNIKTKYYSPEIHFASQVLPKYQER